MEYDIPIKQWTEAVLENELFWTLVISVLLVILALGITLLILKFSSKLENFLDKLHCKSLCKRKDNPDHPCKRRCTLHKTMNYLISGVIFFYDGIKVVVIMAVIVESVNFLLKISGLSGYYHYQDLLRGVFQAVTLTIFMYYIYRLARILSLKIYIRFNKIKPKKKEHIKHKSLSLFLEDKLLDIAKYCVRLVFYIVYAFLLYIYITFLFSFFKFTQTWSGTLFGYILEPFRMAFSSVINYLPSLFAIVVIYFLIKYILKLVKYMFDAIENETIVIPNFYKDWAPPTYKIVRFLIIVFGMIVTFPYLPGASSPFFKGISVFIGVLFSLGSSSAISNIVAGVVLTYMRPFRIGDIVKIGDVMGRVTDKTLLVTRMRTIKHLDITIPNSIVLGSHIINYCSSSEDSSLVLHAAVGIGYETPWQKVHEILFKVAASIEYVLDDPKPYVLQKSLDDYYVTYELNVYTKNPLKMQYIYSELNKYIMDFFHAEKIELVTTVYTALRDGRESTVPNAPETGGGLDIVGKLFK